MQRLSLGFVSLISSAADWFAAQIAVEVSFLNRPQAAAAHLRMLLFA